MRGKSTLFSAVLILIWTHICMNRLAMMNDFPIFPSLLALWYFPSICTFCKNRKANTSKIKNHHEQNFMYLYFLQEQESKYYTDSIVSQEQVLPKEKDESVETTPAKIVGKSNPFKSTLKANEIKLLTECVNEANMFTTTVSTKILTDFFNCKLDGVLKVNNTRLLAYLMMQLSCYNYIVYEWQSVIANNKLILKKIKGEPLTRTDLSSATDQAKNIYPKGYEIIDKYIKQLQKG